MKIGTYQRRDGDPHKRMITYTSSWVERPTHNMNFHIFHHLWLRIAYYNLARVDAQTGHSFWLYSFHHVLKYKLEIPWLAARFDPVKSRIALVGVTVFDILRGMLGSMTSAMLVLCGTQA